MVDSQTVRDSFAYVPKAAKRLLRYYLYGIFAHVSLMVIVLPAFFVYGFVYELGLPFLPSSAVGLVLAVVLLGLWGAGMERYSESDDVEEKTAVAAD